ncbi:MAG: CRISPR-associated endonuclease Cas1 [Desulfatibacillaceae bacterium]|nr:CRISPR-associated endonuclease Cas1 [Desulfatibacillaceae bacterium]
MDLLFLLHLHIRFLRETRFHFFHHAAFHAALRDRLGNPDNLPEGMAFYTPERGRVFYSANEPYNLGVALKANGPVDCKQFLRLVSSPPKTRFGNTFGAPFGNNFVLEDAVCAVSGKSVENARPRPLTLSLLQKAAARLAKANRIKIRTLSPVNIRITQGIIRPLMGGKVFYPDKFLAVIYEALKQWWPNAPFLEGLDPKTPVEMLENRLLRTDVGYAKKTKSGEPKALEGVSGSFVLHFKQGVGLWALPLLMGGIIGASRPTHRRQGQGRYEVEGYPLPCNWPPRPARTILERAADDKNIALARAEIVRAGQAPGVDGQGRDDFLDELAIELPRLKSRLCQGEIKAQALRGLLIRENDPKGQKEKLRPLAIPVFQDRFLQRAVLHELEAAVDQLWEDVSFAYRKGFSYKNARKAVDDARKEGFDFVLDADIKAFFDTVDWDALRLRLEAYFGDDPVVDALMAWVMAPIEFSGTLFRRDKGLPQGAVVSPLLANLYLDAFDEEISAKGFRLALKGDNFVIRCKTKEETRQAYALARQELERLNLVLNDEKTRETSFDEGFSFLGAVFCRSVVLEAEQDKKQVTAVLDKMPQGLVANMVQANPIGWLKNFLDAAGQDQQKEAQAVRWRPAIFPPAPLKRPIYVITGKAKLSGHKKGLIIEKEGEAPRKVAWNEISEIVILGGRWVSGPVVQRAMLNRVPIAFHKWDGTPLGLVLPDRVRSPSMLALKQWEWIKDDASRLNAARVIVAAKIRNTRLFVRRRKEPVGHLLAALKTAVKDAQNTQSIESLRGIEGYAAHAYFSHWNQWTGARLGNYPGRITRKAADPINSMLNLLYMQLFRLTHTTILSTGLDPYLGALHEGKGRYAALAADLMEPFRFLADRIVLNAVNQRLVGPKNFIYSEKGPYRIRLDTPAMARLIGDFENLLASKIADRFDTVDTYRGHLYRQAVSLANLIEGNDKGFLPFEMKW